MSWVDRRRNLLRKELAGLEADVALCERCFGDLPRHPVRFDRPEGLPRVLVLGERATRRAVEAGERLTLDGSDATTRSLRTLLEEAAGVELPEVMLGVACHCRASSRELERAIPPSACIDECAAHVRELVRIVGPRLVIAAGAEATRSLKSAFPASRALDAMRFPDSVGTTIDAGGVWIRCVYSTAARARVARSEAAQRADWEAIGALWRWIRDGEGGLPP